MPKIYDSFKMKLGLPHSPFKQGRRQILKISKTFAEMSEFERWQELVRLTTVLGSDRQLRQVDALYLPGLSRGMIESGNLLMLAAKLRQDNVAHTISFDGSNG